ncbi:MAG: aminopeptidase [Gemmatimonadaceae bacterium]|nr:aminopeptidase [Gemmatimonadaceae bacterium]
MRCHPAFVVAVLGALAAEAPLGAQASITSWTRIADVMVQRFGLQRGERVLLVGLPGTADSLVPALRAAIVRAGGTDLGAVAVQGDWPGAWDTDFTQRLRATNAAEIAELLDDVDLGVMLPGVTALAPIYAAFQEKLRDQEGRTVHFHWAGAYRTDGTLFEPTATVDAHYQRVILETDYTALAARQREFEQAMRTGEVRVTTPSGTDLRFRIGDRPVTRQDGDASAARAARGRSLIDREVELPAGAVRVAPIEESVEGTIVFPPGDWGGERVEGLRMTFTRGKVVAVEATSGRAGVDRELQQAGPGARAFREFALGFNPLLAVRTDDGDPWIPYYGYGAGVVRLSLGDNTELGGSVGGGYVRWNFFTDATVTIDGKRWSPQP